jgi:hypothetical protein
MKRLTALQLLACASMSTGVALAAPCPNVVGTWNFTLQCVRADTNPAPPPATVAVFGTLAVTGIIAQQQGCTFAGDLGGFGPNSWIGALSGSGGDTVSFNWFGATGTGEISGNQKNMTLTYTYSATGAPTTACTGSGVKQ